MRPRASSCELRATCLLLARGSLLVARSLVFNLGPLGKDFVDPHQGRSSALENVDDPAERDNWPGELHHVSVEGDKIADGHFSEKDLSSAEPQHDDNGGAQHEFERGPEHSHQADQAEAAADVFLISALEGGNLCLLLHIAAEAAG